MPERSDPHFRPPRQGRSRKTLDRIAVAALQLIEAGGPEAATVAAVVERAGSSIGSFYARFPGREDLLRYLQDRVGTEARERWDQAFSALDWPALSLHGVVEEVVGLLVRSHRADYNQRRVLGRVRNQDGEGGNVVRAFDDHVLGTVTPVFLARRHEMSHPDPEWAVELGYRMVVLTIQDVIERGEDEGRPGPGGVGPVRSLEAVAPELARAWAAYLTSGTPRRELSEEGVVDFFDPWGDSVGTP